MDQLLGELFLVAVEPKCLRSVVVAVVVVVVVVVVIAACSVSCKFLQFDNVARNMQQFPADM